jgi:hypothetical protein
MIKLFKVISLPTLLFIPDFPFVAKQKLVFPDIELANFTNIELISDEHNKTLPYKSRAREHMSKA